MENFCANRKFSRKKIEFSRIGIKPQVLLYAYRYSPDEEEVASYCAFYALAVLGDFSNTELQIRQILDTFKVTI